MTVEALTFDPGKSVSEQLLVAAAQLVDKTVGGVLNEHTGYGEASVLDVEAEEARR